MKTTPSLPLFVDDYEAATAHLSLEEDGAYMRLLRLCWRTPGCSIPADPAWIMRKLRVDEATYDRVVAPIIKEFFRCSRARIYQKRLVQEFAYVESLSKVRKEAGKRGGINRALKNNEKLSSKANGLPEPNGKQNEGKAKAPIPIPTPTLFPLDKSNGASDSDVQFWANAKAYLRPFTQGDPGKLVGKWLKEQGKELTIGAITAAQVERAVNPVEYMQGYFRRHGKQAATEPERPIC